jgi:hypothetical protein
VTGTETRKAFAIAFALYLNVAIIANRLSLVSLFIRMFNALGLAGSRFSKRLKGVRASPGVGAWRRLFLCAGVGTRPGLITYKVKSNDDPSQIGRHS